MAISRAKRSSGELAARGQQERKRTAREREREKERRLGTASAAAASAAFAVRPKTHFVFSARKADAETEAKGGKGGKGGNGSKAGEIANWKLVVEAGVEVGVVAGKSSSS